MHEQSADVNPLTRLVPFDIECGVGNVVLSPVEQWVYAYQHRRIMARKAFTFILLLALVPQQVLSQPTVREVVDQVRSSSYRDIMASMLANEGNQRGYNDDASPQPDLLAARTAIAASLTNSLGAAAVTTQNFVAGGYPGVNIIGVLAGAGPRSGEQYVISAHYDSEQNPGADDDASGVAGVLEAARVLGKYQFDATIVFVAFDQEEERENGFARGSATFVRRANKAALKGVLVLDTIAYRPSDRGVMTLSRCDKGRGTKAQKLLRSMTTAMHTYTSLRRVALTEEDSSDPYRFFRAGVPALLVSEEYDSDGWPINPYYHEAEDFYLDRNGNPNQCEGREYLDMEYASEIVKGVVAWGATAAGLIGPATGPELQH